MPVLSDKNSRITDNQKDMNEDSECEGMDTDQRSPTKSDKDASSDSSTESSSDEGEIPLYIIDKITLCVFSPFLGSSSPGGES